MKKPLPMKNLTMLINELRTFNKRLKQRNSDMPEPFALYPSEVPLLISLLSQHRYERKKHEKESR